MELINKDLILREFPLFVSLSEVDRDFIRDHSEVVEFKKNQLIYEEASPASFFYCVVMGRVLIFAHNKFGKETVLEYLHRGKYFGIISLLTGEAHSVSAKALNDCVLLVIKKEDFVRVLERIPALAIDFSHTLSRRLKSKDIHQKTVFESKVISVFSSYPQAGKTVYALNLGLGLNKETHKPLIILDVCAKDKKHSLAAKLDVASDHKVLDLTSLNVTYDLIREHIINDKFGIDVAFFNYDPENESCIKRLIGIFSLLANDYYYIVLDLPSEMDKFVFSILNQSDSIHVLTSPDEVDLKRTHNLVKRLKDEFEFYDSKIKIIINEYKLSGLNFEEQVDLLGQNIYATLPKIELGTHDRIVLDEPNSEYARAIRRISRQSGDCLVGLALGVGVAYGLCHIGVLKVIEEERIPIDVIVGSSMGSVIASLWATGRSANEILRITQEFKDPRYIWALMDFTLPLVGFIKGKKLYNFLKKYFGNKTFNDLKLPLKIVASDVNMKEPRVIEKGFLVDAIMASCSMPGVFSPFRFKGDVLFDGGIIHPLPTEPLFAMGINKIIAVNVTPSREDLLRQRDALKESINKAYKTGLKSALINPIRYFKEKLRTNIINTVFNSIEFMQSELAQREGLLADVVLHPDTSGMHWMELGRAQEFAKRGEEEARRHLDKILKMVNE
ncbi:MAG: patatin-like phospholipase family protein [Candidatus Omnitrophica bacterium]|nr:patatin-like phospholipase family protein [Candidatus Omnitrophota bacterium]